MFLEEHEYNIWKGVIPVVCENWKGYVVKHNYVNQDVSMTNLDNYMFRSLLAIFSLSSKELKVLLYIYCART